MADNIRLDPGVGGELLASEEVGGRQFQLMRNGSRYLFSEDQDTLADSAEIDSGWLDMQFVDKAQVEIVADAVGLTIRIESSSQAAGAGKGIVSTQVITQAFLLFNTIVRQRYMRYRLQNASGGDITNVNLAVKGTYGSSDKLSVFPLAQEPNDFSQAALVQAVAKGQQPDGDYVNTPADGQAFSTSSALAIGATYTSPWTDSDGWKSIEIFIKADQVSADDGVIVDFTDDANAGSPTVQASEAFAFDAEDLAQGFKVIRIPPLLDGFRVRYVNGGTPQSVFLLVATLLVTVPEEPRLSLDSPLELGTVAPTVRAVIAGRSPGNGYLNADVNEGGALVISDFLAEVGRGKISGYDTLTKFGRTATLGSGGTGDVWRGGNVYTGQPTTNVSQLIEIFSSSGLDTLLGTGMRTARIIGLKTTASTVIEFEDVNLNGTTSVFSLSQWYRIFTVYGVAYGNGGNANAGTITVRHSVATTNVFAQLDVGFGRSEVGAFTVPASNVGYIESLYGRLARTNGSEGAALLLLMVREPGRNSYNAIRTYNLTDKSPANPPLKFPIKLPAGSDVKGRVIDVSDPSTEVTLEMDVLFEPAA